MFKYIKEKLKSSKVIILTAPTILDKYFAYIISVQVFLGTFSLICSGVYFDTFDLDFRNRIYEFRGISLTIYGVLIGVFMTFLVSRSIQSRQERLVLFEKLKKRTIQLHKLRFIVHKLINSGFLDRNKISTFNSKYKGLRFSEYQQACHSEKIITPREKKLLQDLRCNPAWLFYLQLKFFIDQPNLDLSLYTDKNIYKPIPLEEIISWHDTDCANCFFYFLEYQKVEEFINWRIHHTDEEDIVKACKEIDPQTYDNMVFNKEWLVKLGNHFYQEIIPSAYILQAEIESGLPSIIKYLKNLLVCLSVFGIIFPVFSYIFGTLLILDMIAISMLISICTFIVFSISDVMKKEVSVAEKYLVY